MSIVAVDTDVVSIIFEGHSLRDSYIGAVAGRQAVISFMSLAEPELWTARRSRRQEGERLYRFLICAGTAEADRRLQAGR